MTFILKQIYSFFKLLNSDTGENQIAAGIACGLVLGFAPVFSLQTVLVVILLFFFRIQIGAATLTAIFFKFIAWCIDPAANVIGMSVLEMQSLQPLFTQLYNMPIVPMTRFYNSIVMGSGIISILLFPFVFLLSRKLVRQYRLQVVDRVKETKVWKALAATKIYDWYSKYDSLYGKR
jgi:uncharacterized protein (TIGR03546 family)